MKRVLNIAEQIHQLLLKNTIMSLKQLRSELQDRPRSSLFRDLKKLDLISSYTHTGQYHALTRLGSPYKIVRINNFNGLSVTNFQPPGMSEGGLEKT